MFELEFKNQYFLLLLIPYFIMVFFYFYKGIFRRSSAIAVSSREIIDEKISLRSRTYRYLPGLRFLSILFLIIAVTRPGRGIHLSSVKNTGIDIMIALDVSGSMDGKDFNPKNRLTVAKKVIKDFIKKRKNDRIGMVIFGRDAHLQCPLTIEHNIILEIIDEIDFDSVDYRRTAIGDSLALATSRMMDRKTKSKIIMLITDGSSNSGTIDPETAAKAAAELGIKVYSVGIGKKEGYSVQGFFGIKRQVRSDLDEETLKKISKITGGKYYNATSSGVLWENIKDIDRLERSEVDLNVYHRFFDKFQIFLILSMSIFFLEMILRSLVYRKVP